VRVRKTVQGDGVSMAVAINAGEDGAVTSAASSQHVEIVQHGGRTTIVHHEPADDREGADDGR